MLKEDKHVGCLRLACAVDKNHGVPAYSKPPSRKGRTGNEDGEYSRGGRQVPDHLLHINVK